MAIPLLEYSPSSQNQRVAGYEVPGDENPPIFSLRNRNSPEDIQLAIEAAYRQIFFHAFKSDREPILESQLRYGQISVRQFIRGLLLSDTFKRSFYNLNNNYRFVEQCVQRVLGRDVYSEREKIAWSIVVATKGLEGFVDDLLNSEEYMENFGEDIVPYQRRRILPQRPEGERPFNITSPRYDEYYRGIFGFPQIVWQNAVRRFTPQEQTPKEGDPRNFLNAARNLSNKGNAPSRVSAMNLNYMDLVPRR
ncbi:phycobilisome rod-core linker polypeptide [Spirulina sp. CS-785/01]|uniref:phycobilisome rod-core linker polypeptide n=1 Tax=Spirulina sp. CS-785/01 TaxID=3021716 RepID=UPI00232B002D|nr:phycobilisome rod-core linker polypeptide [Spirulina sp. CS-785/01]MDB9315115.1 phycobilisome rod-core linker polypeptide [Spirulina sp. CS-785/01]